MTEQRDIVERLRIYGRECCQEAAVEICIQRGERDVADRLAAQRYAEIARLRAERDALRSAAERVCWFDWSDNDSDAVASVDALRTLLSAGE